MLSFIDSEFEMWDESESEAIADVEPPPLAESPNNAREDKQLRLLVKWLMIFVSRLRVMFSLSDAASVFILKFSLYFLDYLPKFLLQQLLFLQYQVLFI